MTNQNSDANSTKSPLIDRIVAISTISGILSGSIAKLFTHPLDTIKSKSQIYQTKEHMTIRQVVKITLEQEGISGFFKGLPITLIGSIPASGLYFGSYEFAKKNLLSSGTFKDHDFISHFAGGMFAETISCILWVPIDIIRERRQVQSNLKQYEYKNDFNALTTIIKTEGVRGIYRAYLATLASFGPTSALYFTFFEQAKGFFVKNDKEAYLSNAKENKVIKLSFYQSVLCSMFASGLSSFITSPLDLVKFRMQVQRASSDYNKETAVYKNMLQGLYRILSKEGFKALYRGSQARVLSMMPQGTLIMTMVEQVKPLVSKLF